MKTIRFAFILLLLIGTIFCSYQMYLLEQEKISLKKDLVELSNIKYGLFNVDEWKKIMAEVISKKFNEFDLEDSNKEEMRVKISNFLSVAINDFEKRYYDKKSRSLLGILQGSVAAATGAFDKIKEDIPVFTEQILDFLNDDENREAIRQYLTDKLNEYADETFSKTDYTLVAGIMEAHGQREIESAKEYLSQLITELNSKNEPYKIVLTVIGLASLLSLLLLKHENSQLLFFIAISLVFLGLGLVLPMIEIDARITNMSFTMMGEEIQFSDQILYYKSKSILEVVQLMVVQGRVDLLIIGVLVLTFSVLFPISKLICSVIYIRNPHVRRNAIVSFLVMKSGKWSMADVMVIAIFMAFIGFEGIISEQLKQLESISSNINLLTTNNSNLLFGFYMFTSFVIISLFISQRIQAVIQE